MTMCRVSMRLAVVLLAAVVLGSPAARGGAPGGDAVAVVNGEAISQDELFDVLLKARGVEILQQLVMLRLAKIESRKAGLRVTDADIQREFEDALDSIAETSNMKPDEATRENKLAALRTLLVQKHISMAEFMIGMERNAHIRKVVEPTIQVDEPTLREEFARTYGEKVEIRHIQIAVNDGKRLNDVLSRLAAGEDFARVAQELSQNPETAPLGGLMEPFSFNDARIPAGLREAAFALKVGQRTPSAVVTGEMAHVVQLERRIAPDTVRFEDVRAEVERKLRQRVVPEQMGNVLADLFAKAEVRVLDEGLRRDYQQFLKDTAAPNAAGRP